MQARRIVKEPVIIAGGPILLAVLVTVCTMFKLRSWMCARQKSEAQVEEQLRSGGELPEHIEEESVRSGTSDCTLELGVFSVAVDHGCMYVRCSLMFIRIIAIVLCCSLMLSHCHCHLMRSSGSD